MDKWKKSKPTEVGWYVASVSRSDFVYRWWDGRKWSECAMDTHSAEKAARKARQKVGTADIEWLRKVSK